MQNYEIVEQLSSSTYKVVRKADQRVLTLKKISYVGLSKTKKKSIVDMINNMIQFRCNNVVRYHNCIVDSENGTLNLFADFVEGGTIKDLISRHVESKRPIDEERIWSIATDIALALYECHNHKPQPISHGSLSTEHVLLESASSAKIGCFSLNACQSIDIEKDISDLGKIIFEMATLSKIDENQHSFQYKLKGLSEGMSEVLMRFFSPLEQKFSLVGFLEFPEVALKVLEKKLKIETAFYEQEKAKYLLLENNLNKKEKAPTNHDEQDSIQETM